MNTTTSPIEVAVEEISMVDLMSEPAETSAPTTTEAAPAPAAAPATGTVASEGTAVPVPGAPAIQPRVPFSKKAAAFFEKTKRVTTTPVSVVAGEGEVKTFRPLLWVLGLLIAAAVSFATYSGYSAVRSAKAEVAAVHAAAEAAKHAEAARAAAAWEAAKQAQQRADAEAGRPWWLRLNHWW